MATERNPNLYAGAARYYTVGRAAYPPELADRIAAELDLDGTGRLLDVGCGPGSLTLLLADRVATAVGVDPDAGMLAEADRLARAAGVGNVGWRQLYAEDLPADLDTFRLVTFAQSFHWVDQARVAETVRTMLAADGACVHVHATTHRGIDTDAELPFPTPPHQALLALAGRYLEPGRKPVPPGRPGAEAEIYRSAGFRGPRTITIARPVVTRTTDEVMAALLSLSGSTPYLFGDRLDDFAAEAGDLLRQASPSGRFSEQLREIAADVWRVAEHYSEARD